MRDIRSSIERDKALHADPWSVFTISSSGYKALVDELGKLDERRYSAVLPSILELVIKNAIYNHVSKIDDSIVESAIGPNGVYRQNYEKLLAIGQYSLATIRSLEGNCVFN